MTIWYWIRRPKLKMVWRIRKNSQEGVLIGTAHFSPFHFRSSLSNLVKNVEIVLFEGPLDSSSMEQVVAAGRQGPVRNHILDELEPECVRSIADVLGIRDLDRKLMLNNRQSADEKIEEVYEILKCMTPWMTFFSVYTAYLRNKGWRYSVDLEAYCIAKEMGKPIVSMETIEDQIRVLDEIPRHRLIDFFGRIDSWSKFTKDFIRWYLAGNIRQIAENPYGFPTRTPRAIDQRDVLFCRKMLSHLGQGKIAVFVGAPHIPGMTRILEGNGYSVEQEY